MLNQKQLVRALLVLGLFFTGSYLLPFHLHPYRTYYQDGLALFGVIFSLAIACATSKVKLRIPATMIVPLGFIAVIGLQTLSGLILYPIDMVFPVIYFICLALALICGATMAMQDNGLRALAISLAYTFIAVGLFSVLFEQVQILNVDWTPLVNPIAINEGQRPFANVAQPNLLALALCFSVASVWFLYLKSQIRPWAGFTLAVFLLWGLALTQSRIAWVILPMYVALCWHQPANCPKVSKPLLLLLVLVFIGFVFYLPHVLMALGIVGESVQHRATQTSVRLVLWQQAWTMSAMHPWFGVGWYQFGPQQIILSSMFRPSEYSEYAHNILLSFAAEIGWPLTILLAVGTLYWSYSCCIRRWENEQIRFISLMLLAIAVHSMVEYPLWDAFVLMPFGVMVGALQTERLGWKELTVGRPWIIAITMASVVVMGGMSWDYSRVVNGFVELVLQQKGKTTAAEALDKPEFTLFSQFYDYFHIIKIKIQPNMPKGDIEFLERASLRFGFMPVLSRMALAYAYNQRPTEALKVLYAIDRTNPVEYNTVYTDWISFAQKNDATFGEVARRMPKPEVVIKSGGNGGSAQISH